MITLVGTFQLVRTNGDVMMALAHKDDHQGILSNRALVTSVLWILALLAAYFLLTDWHSVPSLIASTLAAIR